MSFCCTSDKVTISGIFQGCVGITLQQWAQQLCCVLFVDCLSPSGVDSFMCETCFCFLCLSPLSTRALQLSGFYNCSWINDTAIVHLFRLFFFPEDSLRHAYSNTTEDANNQFFTPHICDRRCVTCKIPCEVCVVVHGTDLRTVTLCEYLWTGLLSVLTKTL